MPGETVPTNLIDLIVSDSNKMPWSPFVVQQTGAVIPSKDLYSDPDTGMEVSLTRYAAGFMNVWHTHPCAHGIWVIDGILKTHQGEYGPGTFVWFPEGGWMQHGATEDNEVTFLFITNKPFEIKYEGDNPLPYPMHEGS